MEYGTRELYAVYVAGVDGAPKPAMVQRMCTGGFSWLALLITPMYLLYRKQYVAEGCWFALSFFPTCCCAGRHSCSWACYSG